MSHTLPTVSRRRWLFLLAALLATTATLPPLCGAEEKSATVQLTVDYGDGVRKQFTALPWKSGQTVLDALTAAAGHARGIEFTQQGKDETALVTSIDGLKNEGSGKNWLFEVGGKLGDRSAGIYELQAGDVVLWKFAPSR